MKRQSIAEQTLIKQLRIIEENIVILEADRDKITNQIFGMSDVQLQLQNEINDLRNRRIAASDKAKAP